MSASPGAVFHYTTKRPPVPFRRLRNNTSIMSDKAPSFLFDLDGTLVDSAPDLVAAINETRRDEGLSPVPYEAIRIYASKGAPGLLRAAFGIERDDPTFADRRERFLRHYGESGFTGSKLYTGIEEMLSTLKEGGWRLGVVTNKVEPLAHPLCERLGLMKYLDLVIGSDHEGCAMKPSPSMLLTAMEILEADPHGTFYAGDDPRDVEAAKAASIPCAACAWGYIHSAVESWGANFIAETPEDLSTWAIIHGATL